MPLAAPTPWNDAAFDALEQMWADSEDIDDIARHFGVKSKAILVLVNWLELPARADPEPYEPRPRPMPAILLLGANDCRWPLSGDARHGTIVFCGALVDPGAIKSCIRSKYCADHGRIAVDLRRGR